LGLQAYLMQLKRHLSKNRELIRVFGKCPNIRYKEYQGYQSRNASVISLIQAVFNQYGELFRDKVVDFYIYTGDKPETALKYLDFGKPVFAFSTIEELKHKIIPIPDFIYTGWPEVGIASWEETVAECQIKADKPYDFEQCFWIGNPKTHTSRDILLQLSRDNPKLLKAIDMAWLNNEVGIRNAASQHVTIPDHAAYKSLIDVRGVGYSGRIKLLMQLKRPLFIVERPQIEFFYHYMVPFKHFIPVKGDMSDLIEKLQWLSDNNEEYKRIVDEGSVFAKKYLSKEFALEYLQNVIREYGIKK